MSALLFPMRKKQYWRGMGSRIRYDPDHLYEVWVEIARPTSPDDEPFVIQKFPHDYNDKEVLKTVPRFAFPCAEVECKNVDHFTFVFTDLEAKYKFGFCRYATGAETCMCIISCLPWYEIFYRLLNQLADVLNRHQDNLVDPLLLAIWEHGLPAQVDERVQIIGRGANIQTFTFTTPDPGQLPTIPENRNLTEYFIAVDPSNMMLIFASILFERRILVVSRKMSRLTACVHGAASLLYPMQWQHLYIPILPSHLMDYCSAPMPFIIGLHSSLLQKAKSGMDLGDVVILDADNNRVTTPHDDLATLPADIVSSLKKRLRSLQADKISQQQAEMSGDELARAFLKALVGLIGGYRDALKFREGEQITFDREAFVQSRPPTMTPFLEKILHLQIFEEFINDRLDLLNSGVGFSDEFEMEANDYNLDSAGKYNYWLGSMKKQGKKLRREGIEALDGFKKKANPAMKSAVKNVKDKGKRAYKDLKSKIDEIKKPGSRSESPTRPATIVVTEPRNKRDPVRYNLMTVDDIAINDHTSDDRLAPEKFSFRLLDDPDIQTALKKSYSAEALFGQVRKASLAESESLSESSSAASYSPARPSPLVSANQSDERSETTPPERPTPPPRPQIPPPRPPPLLTTLRGMASAPPLAPPIPAPRRRPELKISQEAVKKVENQAKHLQNFFDDFRVDDENQSGNSAVASSSIHNDHHGKMTQLKAAYMGVEVDEPTECRQPRIQRSPAFRTSTDRGTTQKTYMDQFDPLSEADSATITNVSSEDEDLLKDWSLDFSFLNNSSLSRKTPTPPAQLTSFQRRTSSTSPAATLVGPGPPPLAPKPARPPPPSKESITVNSITEGSEQPDEGRDRTAGSYWTIQAVILALLVACVTLRLCIRFGH